MSFLRHERGSVGVVFALTVLIAFGLVGLAIDLGRAIEAKRHLQQAVDAAALAASQPGSLSAGQRRDRALHVFEANVAHMRWGKVAAPTIEASDTLVAISASISVETILAHLILPAAAEAVTLAASAGAQVGSGAHLLASGPACILALDESGPYGLKLNGGVGGSTLAANCGIWVNNSTSSAIVGNSFGTVRSSYVCARGGYDTSTTYKNLADEITTPISGTINCPQMADPLASLAAPAVGGCTHTNFKADKANPEPLEPGVYCGGITITARSNVTFKPGVYVIKDGQFTINQGGSTSHVVSGDNVLFYLTGTNARIDWGSNSKVQLAGRSEGDHMGMLIWAAAALPNAHRMGAHSESWLQGTVYSPATEIDIQSSGNVNAGADWTAWVVKQLQLSGAASLTVNARSAGSATPVPARLETGLVPLSKPARLLH